MRSWNMPNIDFWPPHTCACTNTYTLYIHKSEFVICLRFVFSIIFLSLFTRLLRNSFSAVPMSSIVMTKIL